MRVNAPLLLRRQPLDPILSREHIIDVEKITGHSVCAFAVAHYEKDIGSMCKSWRQLFTRL